MIAVANRYASHQLKGSFLRASADLVVACAPMTSLVAGLGLGAAGYLVNAPGLAASGAVVAGAGLYVERMQARQLRRRRRAERMRNRHEVTELRRTIAQLRLDVDAFQRALLDTEAALAARSLPRLPVAEPVAQPVVVVLDEPVAEPVVVVLDEPVHAWVQTPDRDLPELPPRRAFDTGGIPVVDPAPRDRLSTTTDALVYAALTELDEQEQTRRLAFADAVPGGDEADRRRA